MGFGLEDILRQRKMAIELITVAIMAYEDGSDLTGDPTKAIYMMGELGQELESWRKSDLIGLGMCILSILISTVEKVAGIEQLREAMERAGIDLAVGGYGS